jgi:hypothetical protein
MRRVAAIERTPRDSAEEERLLRERPAGWEYLYFAAVLFRRERDLEPKWKEYDSGARHKGNRGLPSLQIR